MFVCSHRDLGSGLIGTQRRLDGESLEEWVRPWGGGLFFAPAAPAPDEFLASASSPDAASGPVAGLSSRRPPG